MARAAGILLHPTSLPGPEGIGTVGSDAYAFADALVAAGMSLWQVLPLGPTGYGDSPYAGLSAFAGNPLLVDLWQLQHAGLLEWTALDLPAPKSERRVDFGALAPSKMLVLRRAFHQFQEAFDLDAELEQFRRVNQEWLEDFALYMALKDAHGLAPWYDWPEPLRRRDQAALTDASQKYAEDVAFHRWVQFTFFGQWRSLKQHANERGIRIIGDIPIFVAYDSADVWAHQDLFRLDADGRPLIVAGVPPDYFSATGQLWGNPHYRWDVIAAHGYDWWISRFQVLLDLVDIVRLDHFRGFAGAWAVPAGNPTAEVGEWVRGPGSGLFNAIQSALGRLPIIAEDLGVITPDVDALRQEFGFPGMKILQFAFGAGPWGLDLPHNFHQDMVVYTGTHDNDTTVGWFTKLNGEVRRSVLEYVGTQGLDISWDFIRLALASVADTAVIPLQDVLRLGSRARMNLPGEPAGNWSWRYADGDITEAHVEGLRMLVTTYGRAPADTR